MTKTGRSPEARLAIGALSCLVALVAALGVWQVVTARSSQQAELERANANAARLASSALGSALDSRLQLLTNLAHQPGVATIFTKDKPAELSRVAEALHVLYPGFASFDIISGAGRVEARWPAARGAVGKDLSTQQFFVAAKRSGKPYITGAIEQQSSPHELVTLLLAPVRDKGGQLAGFLAASIPGATVGSLIGGDALQGSSLVVFDGSGHALLGSGANGKDEFASSPSVAAALAGRTGGASGRVPGYSGDRLVGYAPVPSVGWAVLVEQPYSALNAQIAGLTERLAAIALVVVLASVGTGLLVASLLARLGRERQRATALMTSVGEGVATLGYDGTLQDLNPALERLMGRPRDELVGKGWSRALSLYDQRGDPVPWEGSLASQAASEGQVIGTTGYSLHLARADGQRVPVSMTAAPLRVGDELLGAVVVLRDVSSEREVDQLKSSLVSTVSHELRTPLTMVQGFAELLLSRDDLDAKRSREALEQILGSAQRLGRLIDDLLSVSRIDSGKLQVDLGTVDLATAVAEGVRVAESQPVGGRGAVPSAQGRVVVELPPQLLAVMADRDKLVQVFVNLISNALKYSSAHSPVRVVAAQQRDHVEISVVDEGIGMTDEECTQIFDKFMRADRPEVRRVTGTGLGLYITKSLVEVQHGQIWVKSKRGEGTTFSFSLPVAPVPPESEVVGSQVSTQVSTQVIKEVG